jgi:hypothetical protein
MTVIERCADCATALRSDDRFCPHCGGTANAAAVPVAPPREFRAPGGPLARAGDLAIKYRQLLVIAGALAVFGAIVVLFGNEKAVPETRRSPGYLMVRELQRRGDIDTFKAIEPRGGWETEYSLDDGAAHLRFRGGEMEYDVDRYNDDLKRAIEAEAGRQGFGQNESAASSAAAAASTSSAAM